MPATARSRVLAIVLLQHGRSTDTVICLESLARHLDPATTRVFLVDNASPDDSVARVQRWISGGLSDESPRPIHDTLAHRWWPLRGGGMAWERCESTDVGRCPSRGSWTLIASPRNDGFAAGMNLGIRAALADDRVDAIWLLNNDTVVDDGAVPAILGALDAAPATCGQFGTTVCYYDRPTILQSVGWCTWNPWLATSHRLFDGADVRQPVTRQPRMPGYVYGASWVVRAAALRAVGLLSEDGFLYGEELDWSCRAAPDWSSGLIADAIVWHREGATIGSGAATPQLRSELVDLCGISARLRLTRRFFPARLPAVYSSLLGAALNRWRRGDAGRALAVARLVLRGGLPAPRPGGASSSHLSDQS